MAEAAPSSERDTATPKGFYSDVWSTLGLIEYESLHSDQGSWTRTTDAGDSQDDSASAFLGTPAEIFHFAYKILEEVGPTRVHEEPLPDLEEALLSFLAICLRQAVKAKSAHCEKLMETLAHASRFSRWQKLFGPAVQRPYKYPIMLKLEQPPDFILLVALDTLAETSQPILGSVLRDALRIVNNCCQDDDGNRNIVLDKNGVSRIMSLANRRVEPDLVVPALYNICVEHEIATQQLIHWRIGSGAEPNSEDGFRSPSPSEGALQVLLGLADALSYEERKPLLADLLELVSQSVVQDLDRLRAENSNVSDVDDGRIHLLTELLRRPGMRLAASDTECRVAVCNTVTNLLHHEIYQKILIAGDLIRSFFGMAYPRPPEPLQATAGLAPDPDLEANILHCRRGALKTLYAICALPEFASTYPLDTGLVQDCLKSVRESQLASTNSDAEYNRHLFPLSASFVILTSLTQSEQIARALIEDEKIHERLRDILRNVDDHDILYPAISFVGRLALPAPNKNILREYGLLEAMERFFTLDTTPNIQREAVVAVRRLAAQPPHSPAATDHAKNAHHRPTDLAVKLRAPLAAALALFRRTEDRSLRLEIGRLAIETCRTLWRAAAAADADGPSPAEAEAEDQFTATVGDAGPAFAEAISFVVLHGENPGARGEGWFGFALLSGWSAGKVLIADRFDGEGGGEDMSAVVREVLASSTGPDYENLRAILANLNALRYKNDAVPSETRSRSRSAVLEDAAVQMGLARSLPEPGSPR